MDIWARCKEAAEIVPLEGNVIRVVESQQQVATNALVDDLAEQALLEELLEASKPPVPAGWPGLHYLFITPFRYPPLLFGSRFGARHETGLFYGSLSLLPALAEAAYYRLVFWSGMAVAPVSGKLTTEHTVFAAQYAFARGLRLHQHPFSDYKKELTHPAGYSDTRQLGREMRAAGLAGFEYRSARDPQQGINLALFTPAAFAASMPAWQQTWLCETRETEVSFYSKVEGTYLFPLQQFLFEGVLPNPAL